MPISNRYVEMRVRLRELRKNMLPRVFSPTGDYSDRILDRARGYRLLVHAEIESYLEDITKQAVMNAIRKWKKDKKPSYLMVAFISSYHSSWNVNSEVANEDIIRIAKSRINVKESIDEIIDLAQTQFIQKIKDNHGIKEKILKLWFCLRVRI